MKRLTTTTRRMITAIFAATAVFASSAQTIIYIPTRPANDNFADATQITGTEGILSATTDGATMEENEPLALEYPDENSHTVWFKWTAPSGVNRVAFYTYDENGDAEANPFFLFCLLGDGFQQLAACVGRI